MLNLQSFGEINLYRNPAGTSSFNEQLFFIDYELKGWAWVKTWILSAWADRHCSVSGYRGTQLESNCNESDKGGGLIDGGARGEEWRGEGRPRPRVVPASHTDPVTCRRHCRHGVGHHRPPRPRLSSSARSPARMVGRTVTWSKSTGCAGLP